MSQTKKEQAIPVVQQPWSPKETRHLEHILQSDEGRRTALKQRFVSKHNRQRKDVDNWLYRNDPTKAQGKKKAATKTSRKTAVKSETTVIKKTIAKKDKKSKVGVIRLPVGSVKQGDVLRLEIIFL